jgi:DNA polymerase III epsilon subunit-like protein
MKNGRLMKSKIEKLKNEDVNLIFYDLEFCKKYRKGVPSAEIVQIGALKTSGGLSVISTFESLIKPSVDKLDKYCMKVTGLTIDDLREKSEFCDVIEEFDSWVGEEPSVFIAWGSNDFSVLSTQIVEDKCATRNIPLHRDRNIDLQEIVVPCGFDALSLENALSLYGKTFDGAHDALEDAQSLYELYREFVKDSDVVYGYYSQFTDAKIVSIRKKVKRTLEKHRDLVTREHEEALLRKVKEMDDLNVKGVFKTPDGVEMLHMINQEIRRTIAGIFE